jgi:hypothetical protein
VELHAQPRGGRLAGCDLVVDAFPRFLLVYTTTSQASLNMNIFLVLRGHQRSEFHGLAVSLLFSRNYSLNENLRDERLFEGTLSQPPSSTAYPGHDRTVLTGCRRNKGPTILA